MFLFPLQFKNTLDITALEDKLAWEIAMAIWSSASLVLNLAWPRARLEMHCFVQSILEGACPFFKSNC